MSASQLAGSAAFCGVKVPFASAIVGAAAGLSLSNATGILLGSLSSPLTLNVVQGRVGGSWMSPLVQASTIPPPTREIPPEPTLTVTSAGL